METFNTIAEAANWFLLVPWFAFHIFISQWRRTVKMSVARVRAAVKVKAMIIPAGLWPVSGLIHSIFTIISGTNLTFAFINIAIVSILGALFARDVKKFLDDEDWFNKTKSKIKRWARNTFAVRKLAMQHN